jgi:hypothetical protein
MPHIIPNTFLVRKGVFEKNKRTDVIFLFSGLHHSQKAQNLP